MGSARPGFTSIVAIAFGLAIAVTAGCYRPRVVDCVSACNVVSRSCPDGMTCSAGLCTRGPTCVTDVAAGARHSCAIRAGGITCFGDNSYGQLGTRAPGSRGGTADTPPIPVDLAGRTATAIVAGARHTCALVSDDEAAVPICWGDNTRGQLGVPGGGTRGAQPADRFEAVGLPAGQVALALTAGVAHTCARLDDGRVVCWGDSRFGQLGLDPAAPTFTPVTLDGPAKAVAAGAYHTCALVAGGVRCWGWNDDGQLGDAGQRGGDVAPGVTVAVPLPAAATAIAAGAFHTCARLETGAVVCWGLNDAGQLGTIRPPGSGAMPPGPAVDLGAGRTAWAIAAGTAHTCAVLDDFSVKCWGFNLEGQLGIGKTSNRGDDEALGDGLPRVDMGRDPVSRLAVGAHHACAIQTSGVKCWGLSADGRLGTGDTKKRDADAGTPIVFATF